MNWRGFYPALEVTVTSLCALKSLQSPETWQKLPTLRKMASTVARPLIVNTYLSVCWTGFSFIITLQLKESVKQRYTQAKPTDTSNLDVWNLRNTRPNEGHQQHEPHRCGGSLRQRHTVTTPATTASKDEAPAPLETKEPGFQPQHFKTDRPGPGLVTEGAVASDQRAVSPQTPSCLGRFTQVGDIQ